MAKNNFLLSDEWKDLFTSLPDEKAGQLIKAAFMYHAGEEIEIDDPVLMAVFSMVKAKMDENDKRYEEICQKRADAARTNKSEQKQANANKSQQTAPDNDSDNDLKDSECINNIPSKSPVKKQTRHKYGEYSHVLLSDEEYKRLCQEHGELIVNKAIKVVDEYCQTSGKTYKDYNLVLRKWGIDRAKDGDSRGSPYLDAIKNRVSVVDSWL